MELYLSRIRLNPFSKAVMKDLGNPRELHRTISSCFPAIDGQAGKPRYERQTPRNSYNLLHRLDWKNGEYLLYVQSSVKPDWNKLRKDFARDVATKPVHELYANISNGDALQFRLQANATKRVGKRDPLAGEKFKDPDKRRRVEIRTEEGRIAWLERKGGECGFRIRRVNADTAVPAVNAGLQPSVRFTREKGHGQVTLGTTRFEGILEVTDTGRFLAALKNGIGPGKAYGFGLMSVAPANRI